MGFFRDANSRDLLHSSKTALFISDREAVAAEISTSVTRTISDDCLIVPESNSKTAENEQSTIHANSVSLELYGVHTSSLLLGMRTACPRYSKLLRPLSEIGVC